MSTITINPQNLRRIVKATLREELAEIFNDPDFGLELKQSAINRLKRSLKSAKAGRVSDLKKVVSELDLSA